MELPVILALAIIVGVAAYALGTYLNRHGGMPSMPRPLRAPPAQRLPGRVTEEREVQSLVNWLLTQAFEQTGVRVADDKMAYQRIVESAHKAVQELKSRDSVTISLPFLTADASGPKHFEIRVTREVIQELARY
jgi:Hsp70 protein